VRLVPLLRLRIRSYYECDEGAIGGDASFGRNRNRAIGEQKSRQMLLGEMGEMERIPEP